jgi:hypothetical protein
MRFRSPVRISNRWSAELWAGATWRLEQRTYRSGGGPPVDYEDRGWGGQAVLFYRPPRGFTASISLDTDHRTVLRGEGQVPADGSLACSNNEIRFEPGWRFHDRSAVILGFAIDTDPGIYPRGWWGGGQARFVFYW